MAFTQIDGASAVYRALASSPAGTPGRQRVRVEVRERGDLGERDARSTACPARCARLSAELDVVGRGLELVRGDGDDALAQDRRRLAHRAGGHRPAAAPGRAGAERR